MRCFFAQEGILALLGAVEHNTTSEDHSRVGQMISRDNISSLELHVVVFHVYEFS